VTAPGGTIDAKPAAPPREPITPGDLGQALEQYRAALAEKPADAELLGNVGQILVAMNRPAEAVPFLERAIEAEPFSIVARFDLAVAYGRSGRLKEAVEQYETLVRSGETPRRRRHSSVPRPLRLTRLRAGSVSRSVSRRMGGAARR
jgi:cytochrome c-type biogenesis protein CcmH/NrfG